LSRVRGNNAEDEGPQDVAGLEGKICASMKIIGKEKMYELFMSTWPEDFEEEEDEATTDE
jgi:hypothetical protein